MTAGAISNSITTLITTPNNQPARPVNKLCRSKEKTDQPEGGALSALARASISLTSMITPMKNSLWRPVIENYYIRDVECVIKQNARKITHIYFLLSM